MQRDGPVLNMALRIFLRVMAQSLSANCPGAADVNKAAQHIGADADADAQASPAGVIFQPASAISASTVAQVQATLRLRTLRAFVARGLLEGFEAKEMLAYQHSGFSVDAGVCIKSHDRAALERLLRYCARPPFAMDRLRKEGAGLVYRCAKQRSEPTRDKRAAKADELHLTPLELIDRIAALVPAPRTHRHRYFGVLAANWPLRAAEVAVAVTAPTQATPAPPAQTGTGTGTGRPGVVPQGNSVPPKRSLAHCLWAVLIARIDGVFSLLCPLCGGHMRLIAFMTEGGLCARSTPRTTHHAAERQTLVAQIACFRRIQWDFSVRFLTSCG